MHASSPKVTTAAPLKPPTQQCHTGTNPAGHAQRFQPRESSICTEKRTCKRQQQKGQSSRVHQHAWSWCSSAGTHQLLRARPSEAAPRETQPPTPGRAASSHKKGPNPTGERSPHCNRASPQHEPAYAAATKLCCRLLKACCTLPAACM
jgi:hypothetical protein